MSEPRVYTVRASSWGSLFDCGYRWQGVHLMGMHKPSGLRAHLGTSVHASTARFDAGRLPGGSKISVADATDVFVDTLHHPDREVDYRQDDLSLKDAEKIGLALHRDYCMDVSPSFEFVSVEQKLQPLDIDCGGGVVVRLTGTMDRARVARSAGGVVIPDLKTGSRVLSNGEPVLKGRLAQGGTYQLMYDQAEPVKTVGAQIIAMSTSSKPRIVPSRVFDARPVMLGTDESPGLIQYAAEMFRSGLFYPNPQSMTCSPRYCARWARCTYHE